MGSTSATSGALNSSSTYYPFGAVRSGTLPTDYTFTGQKRDNEANLMFYNARYYDSAIGRFTQADTIVPNLYNPQSLNRYAYYGAHEIGHILVHGLRLEGIDLGDLWPTSSLHNHTHEDVATAIALGALQNAGMQVNSGYTAQIKDLVNGFVLPNLIHGKSAFLPF